VEQNYISTVGVDWRDKCRTAKCRLG